MNIDFANTGIRGKGTNFKELQAIFIDNKSIYKRS